MPAHTCPKVDALQSSVSLLCAQMQAINPAFEDIRNDNESLRESAHEYYRAFTSLSEVAKRIHEVNLDLSAKNSTLQLTREYIEQIKEGAVSDKQVEIALKYLEEDRRESELTELAELKEIIIEVYSRIRMTSTLSRLPKQITSKMKALVIEKQRRNAIKFNEALSKLSSEEKDLLGLREKRMPSDNAEDEEEDED